MEMVSTQAFGHTPRETDDLVCSLTGRFWRHRLSGSLFHCQCRLLWPWDPSLGKYKLFHPTRTLHVQSEDFPCACVSTLNKDLVFSPKNNTSLSERSSNAQGPLSENGRIRMAELDPGPHVTSSGACAQPAGLGTPRLKGESRKCKGVVLAPQSHPKRYAITMQTLETTEQHTDPNDFLFLWRV